MHIISQCSIDTVTAILFGVTGLNFEEVKPNKSDPSLIRNVYSSILKYSGQIPESDKRVLRMLAERLAIKLLFYDKGMGKDAISVCVISECDQAKLIAEAKKINVVPEPKLALHFSDYHIYVTPPKDLSPTTLKSSLFNALVIKKLDKFKKTLVHFEDMGAALDELKHNLEENTLLRKSILRGYLDTLEHYRAECDLLIQKNKEDNESKALHKRLSTTAQYDLKNKTPPNGENPFRKSKELNEQLLNKKEVKSVSTKRCCAIL